MPFFKELGKISRIAELLEQVEGLIPPRNHRFDSVYLRGQAVYDWTLLPTIARPLRRLRRRTMSASCLSTPEKMTIMTIMTFWNVGGAK